MCLSRLRKSPRGRIAVLLLCAVCCPVKFIIAAFGLAAALPFVKNLQSSPEALVPLGLGLLAVACVLIFRRKAPAHPQPL